MPGWDRSQPGCEWGRTATEIVFITRAAASTWEGLRATRESAPITFSGAEEERKIGVTLWKRSESTALTVFDARPNVHVRIAERL
jgi:hypothetical protein